MTRRNGRVWEERQTRDWVWIEKRARSYFSSDVITCTDAVRIVHGHKRPPRAFCEVKDIGCFEPVSTEVLKLLAKAVDRLKEDSNG